MPADPTRRISLRRWLGLRLATVLLAVSPFVLAETGLRLFVPHSAVEGFDDNPIVDLNQLRPLFELNKSTNRWEIPPERFNFFRPTSFAAKKGDKTRRVFVLGGSTVQGRPYATETAFSTWLKLGLEVADAEHDYEVINCGGVSYASYRLSKILDEILLHQPDAVVLYTGHNEFLEDRSYAHVRNLNPVRSTASRLGSQIRLVQWLRDQVASKPSMPNKTESQPTTLSGEVNARLDHPGGLETYNRDSAWQADVEDHFRVTLTRMIGSLHDARVPVVLCVPASDIVNTPPIKVQLANNVGELRRKQFLHARQQASSETIIHERLMHANVCLGIDPEHAGAHYILGTLLLENGETEKASQHLIAARDHDVCPLRATTSIINHVIEIADAYDVPLVDTRAVLDSRNIQGGRGKDSIPDPEAFVDHLHPSIAGHQKIASALLNEFDSLGWIQWSEQADSKFQNAIADHMGTLGESYFARGKQRLAGLKRWMSGKAGSSAD